MDQIVAMPDLACLGRHNPPKPTSKFEGNVGEMPMRRQSTPRKNEEVNAAS